MSLTIYGIVASRAVRALWTAAELGLDFTHVKTDYTVGGTRTPEFLQLNPNGHIPVLTDGDVTLWESMACALYLARYHCKSDGTSITPANKHEDAEALRWSFWVVNELERDALTVLNNRRADPKPDNAIRAEERVKKPLAVLEAHLKAQQDKDESYLAAARFTIADLCVASIVLWLRSSRDLMRDYPLTSAWLEACLTRPAYQAVRKS